MFALMWLVQEVRPEWIMDGDFTRFKLWNPFQHFCLSEACWLYPDLMKTTIGAAFLHSKTHTSLKPIVFEKKLFSRFTRANNILHENQPRNCLQRNEAKLICIHGFRRGACSTIQKLPLTTRKESVETRFKVFWIHLRMYKDIYRHKKIFIWIWDYIELYQYGYSLFFETFYWLRLICYSWPSFCHSQVGD